MEARVGIQLTSYPIEVATVLLFCDGCDTRFGTRLTHRMRADLNGYLTARLVLRAGR